MIMYTKLPVAIDDYGIFLDLSDVDPEENIVLTIPYIMTRSMLVGDEDIHAVWEQLDGEIDAKVEYDYHPYLPPTHDPDSPMAGPGQDEHVEVTGVWITNIEDGGWIDEDPKISWKDELPMISYWDAQKGTKLLDQLHDQCLADAHKRQADAVEDRSDWND